MHFERQTFLFDGIFELLFTIARLSELTILIMVITTNALNNMMYVYVYIIG